ncbi:hypothetical protein [Paenibacillus sp. MBLB4367]|uniref:hypothetical protein n=1 Tax=Paenibacillus sp. MBLB4367 TaxID=3384767 RepID=UPI0039083E43
MKKIAQTLIGIALLSSVALTPLTAFAASYELSPTMKTAFDKMAAADGKLSDKLPNQYAEMVELQKQALDLDASIKSLHDGNEEAAAAVRKQLKLIDADKLDKLKKDVEQTKARYKPAMDTYTAMNKQIAAARPLKNKDLNAMLRMQADSLKVAVQLARQDIKLKEASLKKAKDSAASAQKKITDSLKGIDPLEDKIKAERAAASSVKKQADATWKAFTPLVKAGSAKPSSDSLSALGSQFRQIVNHKQTIVSLERKIGDILSNAKAQLPAS